jgi:hypothetical protein
MAGDRQGLALLHPEGRNAVEDGADRGFLVPRGMGEAQGKKVWANRCSKGQEAQPSPANQSH